MKKTAVLFALLSLALAGCDSQNNETPAGSNAPLQQATAAAKKSALPKVTENSGMLRISTEPGGAQLFINDERKGSSPTEPGQTFAIKLGEGNYVIRAYMPDGEEWEYHGQQDDVFVADHSMPMVTIKMARKRTALGEQRERERVAERVAESKRQAELQGYFISADGLTVTDKKTGLMWMRCSLGQTWNGKTCAGSASEYNWNQARQVAQGYGHAGYNDWRLPSIDELKTLVYCSSGKRASFNKDGHGGSCEGDYRKPTIFETAFPNTPSSSVWSGSPYANYTNLAWFVHFSNGYDGNHLRSYACGVRLVRGGQ